MTGLTRSAAAKIITDHFGTQATHVGGSYDTYTAADPQGRRWKVVSDASILCQARGERSATRAYSVEVVSPICKYEDIETVQQIIRKLRAGGVKHMGIEPSQLLGGPFSRLWVCPPCLASERLRRPHPKSAKIPRRGVLRSFPGRQGAITRKTPKGISIDIFKEFSEVLAPCRPVKPGWVRFPYA